MIRTKVQYHISIYNKKLQKVVYLAEFLKELKYLVVVSMCDFAYLNICLLDHHFQLYTYFSDDLLRIFS